MGLFDLTWNVLCPGCGGVLDAYSTLKSLRPDDYHCGLCACGYEASVDEQVEVAFTVSPRIRRIAAHDPNTLPVWEYFKQVFWSSGIDLNKESFASLTDEVTLDTLELPAGEKATMSLQLPSDFIIVFEPVTHAAQFIDVQGEPTKDRQQLSLIYNKTPSPTGGTVTLRPGPLRLLLDNQAGVRVLPSVFIAADALHHLIGKRKPFPHRQADADQPDLPRRLQGRQPQHRSTPQDHLADLPVHRPQGSTAVRAGRRSRRIRPGARIHALLEIISSEKAVVKTIGDAVMATFIRPEHAIVAGLRMRAAMDALNAKRGTRDWWSRSGIHEVRASRRHAQRAAGLFRPDRQYRARVQSPVDLAGDSHHGPVIEAPAVAAILDKEAITPIQKQAALRGIADKIVVYKVP